MIYFTDLHLDKPPVDAEKIIFLACCSYTDYFDEQPPVEFYEYWTTLPGEDIQMYCTENNLYFDTTWRLITNDPLKYTTLVSPFRFVNKEGEPYYPNDPFYISREDSIQSIDSVEILPEVTITDEGLCV